MKSHGRIFGVVKTAASLVIGVALMVGVIAWMAGVFRTKIEPGEAGAAERTAPKDDSLRDVVHEVPKEYFEEAVGSLKAASRTEISARVMAPINKIYISAGQPVAEGERLIDLDRRAVETQLSQARARLAAAQAAASQAETDYQRKRNLLEKQVISRQEMDNATTRRDVTLADLDHAKQALDEAEVMLSYTTISAPKPGMIVDKLAQEGDMARPGVPLLVVYDPTSLRLEVPVMENLAVRLKRGQKLTVHIDALDRDVESVVDEIVPQAEAASRSFLVKVKLPRSEDLFEGMYGRLRIPAGRRRHLCLATAAIERVGQLEFVDVIRKDETLERRFIRTGRLGMPGRIEVLSGLEAGEKVVLQRVPK
jgi:membrane fusion protein (multidrug efflux system)